MNFFRVNRKLSSLLLLLLLALESLRRDVVRSPPLDVDTSLIVASKSSSSDSKVKSSSSASMTSPSSVLLLLLVDTLDLNSWKLPLNKLVKYILVQILKWHTTCKLSRKTRNALARCFYRRDVAIDYFNFNDYTSREYVMNEFMSKGLKLIYVKIA